MTQDEIIEMAGEAGFDLDETQNMLYTVRVNYAQLEAFAKLVAEREREACAKEGWMAASNSCEDRVAEAIRARGQA